MIGQFDLIKFTYQDDKTVSSVARASLPSYNERFWVYVEVAALSAFLCMLI